MYYLGRGFFEDKVEFYAWHNVAAALGDEEASLYRDITENDMTPKQLEKAQELSKVSYKKYTR
jgi:hypothetical protein